MVVPGWALLALNSLSLLSKRIVGFACKDKLVAKQKTSVVWKWFLRCVGQKMMSMRRVGWAKAHKRRAHQCG
jgi:hypothetical protein